MTSLTSKSELAINELNQAYFTELKVEGFTLESTDLPAPLKKLDMHLSRMEKSGFRFV